MVGDGLLSKAGIHKGWMFGELLVNGGKSLANMSDLFPRDIKCRDVPL